LQIIISNCYVLPTSHTHSVFHSELKGWIFGQKFPPLTFSFPTGLILWTLEALMYSFCSTLDLFTWCVRLNRL